MLLPLAILQLLLTPALMVISQLIQKSTEKKKSFCQILMSNFAPRGPVWITGTHGVHMENAVGLVAGV